MELQKIKRGYSKAQTEDFNGIEILSVNKKHLDWLIEQAENVETTLYELEILYKKVNPSEYSSVDNHFKRIIDILRNE